jgi:hypothetical protein
MVFSKVMPGRRYFSWSVDGAPVKFDPHEGRLATLPGNCHLVAAMGLDKLGNVSLQHLIAHAKAAAGVEKLLF